MTIRSAAFLTPKDVGLIMVDLGILFLHKFFFKSNISIWQTYSSFSFVEMDFTACRRSNVSTRQHALSTLEPNPPSAVPRTPPAGGNEVTNTPNPPSESSQRGTSTKRGKNTEKNQGQAARVTCSKRCREEEDSAANKRGPTSSVNPPEGQSLQRSNQGEESCCGTGKKTMPRDSFLKLASWLREGFQMLDSQREQMSLATEISEFTPPLTGLHLRDSRFGRILGIGPLMRCVDFDTYKAIYSMDVDDTLGLLGAHLSQVFNFFN